MTALLPALAGSNILYGMGMMELGITFSLGQLLIDAEIVRMIQRVLQRMPVNKDTLAVEVIKAVGAGGDYLSEEHTSEHYRREQSFTRLFDRTMYEAWDAAGRKDIRTVANEKALEIVKNYKPLPLDLSVQKGIKDIIAEAEEELL